MSWTHRPSGATDIFCYPGAVRRRERRRRSATPTPTRGPVRRPIRCASVPQDFTLEDDRVARGRRHRARCAPTVHATLDRRSSAAKRRRHGDRACDRRPRERRAVHGRAARRSTATATSPASYFTRRSCRSRHRLLGGPPRSQQRRRGRLLLSQTYGDGNPLTQMLRDFRDNTLARSRVRPRADRRVLRHARQARRRRLARAARHRGALLAAARRRRAALAPAVAAGPARAARARAALRRVACSAASRSRSRCSCHRSRRADDFSRTGRPTEDQDGIAARRSRT